MTAFYTAMRQCYRKTSFYSKETAKKKVNMILSESGQRLYYYGCTQCGNYHLTKNAKAHDKVF